MDIEVDHCVFADDVDFQAHLLDDTCSTTGAIVENDKFILSTTLDGCGTTVSHDNTSVTFSQTIFASATSGPIFLGNPLELEFSCNYDSQTSATTNAEFEKITSSTGSEGSGNFEFELSLFEDDTFSGGLPDGDVIVVGERVYFSVDGIALPDSVSFVLTSCKVINDEYSMEYDILPAGCPDSLVQSTYHNTAPFTSNAQLSYAAFRFDTDAAIDADQQEVISCMITVCDNDDASSLCATQTC